jgi:DNA-binding LytR/AlgR family response regulator
MHCIIVDDEPFALDLIQSYVEKTPFLELKATFSNPFEALEYLMTNKTDLLFLDINMPELSGIQLLKALNQQPKIIFTTAYSEYGAESYEYNAIDYLLKPIKYERFLKAVTKTLGTTNHTTDKPVSSPKAEAPKEFVFLKSGTQVYKVHIKDILFIEGAGNYMTFHTREKKILSLLTMKEALDLLSNKGFIRIHKSYIVPLNQISIIEKHRVIINDTSLPIGVTYREHFINYWKEKLE